MKPISERKPARQLAIKLRELKGDIPYARLAKSVHVKPNTLSTMADGTFRGWPSVEQFLLAVQKCGGAVTDEDRSQCRAYHKIAETLHRERSSTTPSPAPVGDTPPSPLPPLTETVVLAPRGGEADTEVITFTREEPTPACPASLAQARTVHDLVASLVDLVVDKRLDIESWRPQRRRPWSTGRTGTPEWEVLTGRRPPTLPLVVSIVRECGGGPADTSRWEQQWNRIVAPHGRFVGTASPPQRSRGSEPEIALTTIQPVDDDDLQRIRDRLAATSDGRAAHPSRPPLWRRLSGIRVNRRLTRRTPGATTDQDLDQ
ncbi:hypothetical protein I0C86_13715 [Plantactinospora sp. S1510]|uniref:Helix-turn-helix domain-containing protein n=1 Tax=Plantactinospora alkalitolerans TaxID=2789879 RepID=A0ABS0GUX8_9ACTN|nr:hypothetical protein [Plantactinospora alkalitolerans]MBF9130009.1 hypothetical protein [Plantactinospora alkalitolerans]